jgi:hypothetical protein
MSVNNYYVCLLHMYGLYQTTKYLVLNSSLFTHPWGQEAKISHTLWYVTWFAKKQILSMLLWLESST